MRVVCDAHQIQIKVVATFLIILGTHVNISFIIKMKILMLIEGSYGIPPDQQ